VTCPDVSRPEAERILARERERLADLFLDVRHLLAEVRGDVVDPVRRAKVDAMLTRLGGR
jgi:hypothetical protein